MVFVDNLALELMTLPIVSLILVYLTGRAYAASRSEDYRRVKNVLSEGGIPILGLGIVILALAIWGEATWTLPGSYNILFDDAYAMLGLILTSFGASLLVGRGTSLTGVLAIGGGLMTAWYGLNAYWLNMTKEPIALLGIYGLFGLAAIAGYPMTRVLDKWIRVAAQEEVPAKQGVVQMNAPITRAVGGPTAGLSVNVSRGWLMQNQLLVMGIFWALVIAAGLLSGYVAFSTIPAHLATPP